MEILEPENSDDGRPNMEILFRHENEERARVLEIVKLDGDEFDCIVWRAEHSLVEFVPADRSFTLWSARGKVTTSALGVLVGKELVVRDIGVFRTSGILGVPEQRGKRSIFPLSWNTIPVRDMRVMFMRVLRSRYLTLPLLSPEVQNFYFIPPLILPRSRTYTSTAPTRSARTELRVYCKNEPAEVPGATVCHEAQLNDGERSFSPKHPGG